MPLTHGSHRPRGQGYFYLVFVMILWAVGPLFVKSFASYYDVWTQNGFRYLASTIMLFAIVRLRGQRVFVVRRELWGHLALVAAANLLMQSSFGMIYYFLYPAVATIVGQINVAMVVVLSYLLFHDERRVVRSSRFLIGTGIALAGMATVMFGRDPEVMSQLRVTRQAFWIGIGITIAWSFFSAIYAISIKRLVKHMDPLLAFTNVSWITLIGLLVLMLVLGDVSDLWKQPLKPLVGMVLTGFLCIGIAHTLYYAVIQAIGIVVLSTLMQLVPVLTCTLSAFWYGDRLTPVQIVGAGATLLGAWLAALAQAKAAPTPSLTVAVSKEVL